MKKLDWDQYFMNLVYLIAMRSHDPKTHVGAVIVKPDNSIVSTGYNAFPYGVIDCWREECKDKLCEKCRTERPYKYFFFSHGESNAVLLAARNGHSTTGCRMYTNGIPCTNCAKAVIQAGIIEVITDKQWTTDANSKWKEEAEISKQMFFEASVKLREIDVNLVKVVKFVNGQIFD